MFHNVKPPNRAVFFWKICEFVTALKRPASVFLSVVLLTKSKPACAPCRQKVRQNLHLLRSDYRSANGLRSTVLTVLHRYH